jgi:hypothetical protein
MGLWVGKGSSGERKDWVMVMVTIAERLICRHMGGTLLCTVKNGWVILGTLMGG